MKRVIVVSGNKTHGKNKLAEFIYELVPNSVVRAYADPLKEAVALILGIPVLWCYDQEKKETLVIYGKTLRHWLQWFATEVVRDQVDEGVWVHRLAEYTLQSDCTTVLVPDGRFPNEIQELEETFSAIDGAEVEVVSVRIRRPSVPVDMTHRSESQVANMKDEDFDYVIVNDGTVGDLLVKARALVKQIG